MTRQDAGNAVAGLRGRPAPDDPRKPRSPFGLGRAGWRYALRRALREFGEDGLTDLAAGLTYYAILSFVPALAALLSLLSIFGSAIPSLSEQLVSAGIIPAAAMEVLTPVIETITATPAPGIGLVVGLLGAIWSSSLYVRGFGRAMNRIYEVPEGRGPIRLNAQLYALTAVLLILVAAGLTLITVSGPIALAIGELLHVGAAAQAAWAYGKVPALLVLAIVFMALLYRFTPNVRQPRVPWLSLGAIAALLIAGVATEGFALYLTHATRFTATYGALAGVISFLLLIWIVNVALLFGAELNSELERARQLQAGIEAEAWIQLPPRATKAAKKAETKARADVAEGRRLRLEAAPHPSAAQDAADDAVDPPTKPRREPIDHYPDR